MTIVGVAGLLLSHDQFDFDRLEALLSSNPTAAAAMIRERFKADELAQGANPLDHGTRVLLALEADKATKAATVTSHNQAVVTLRDLGEGLFAAVLPLKDGDGFPIEYRADGKVIREHVQVEVYDPNPLVMDPPGGMKGNLKAMGEFKSKTYPGTTRQWFVYLPPDLDATKTYPLLVGQDAQWDRQWMANALENCAREGKIPQTVGVFIEPGQDKPGNYSNRSFEYDPLNPSYTKMLLEEILPEVEKMVHLSPDPSRRAISGMSSGGICSFTACWERPDSFGVAISFIGSFANIASGQSKREGGHNYPFLIRKTDKKPISVFLQDGANDLDNDHGNWWLCNQQMEAALRFKGYDLVWVPGKGFHSTKHARRVFDQALVWWLGKP